jgi:diguanylate cyclase (GGDEF)-like protein/PAS domain S-box-containing protein
LGRTENDTPGIEAALRESEAKYRLLFEASPQAMWVYDQQTRRFLAVNQAAIRRYGYTRDEFLALSIAAIRPPVDATEREEFPPAAGMDAQTPHLVRHRAKDGTLYWVEVVTHPIIFDGCEAQLVIGTDITERKRAEEALRESEERYRDLIENANDIIYTRDFQGKFMSANAAAVRTYEYTLQEILHMNIAQVIDPAYLSIALAQIPTKHHEGGRSGPIELLTYTKSGRPVWIEVNTRVLQGKDGPVGVQGIARDITERKWIQQHINHLTSHDLLTGLANRAALEENLERAVARARRGQAGTLLFLDLDNFKLVNDTLGHAGGDQLLVTLAQVLGGQLREEDLLARLGGDEFGVLLEGTNLDGAWQVAERIRRAVDAFRFTLGGHTFELGVSMGLAPIDGDQDSAMLLRQAETAMYNAKEKGRHHIMVYHPEEDNLVQLSEANEWCRRIKDALRDDRLLLYFQPVTRLSDGLVEHYEALIRMRGEDGALILPGAFIPAAERFGMMPPVDRWVVRQAIRTLRERPDIHIFMNLSGRSLLDDMLPDFIADELRENAVAAERLGLEITETAAVQDVVRAERWIRRIKALGCQVALDDFGVGFTSFAYLSSLPVDQIKIDGSFIRSLEADPRNRAIVQAMHTVAQSLGKETVAEFVENAAILQIVRAMGVTYGQGYYQGKASADLPPPAPAIRA